jgi:hypothetical protein
MEPSFSYPYMYWVGMNTPVDATPDALAAFSRFYSTVHAPEVLAANPGFVRATRYELLAPDPRNDLAPRWLAVYEMADEAAARGYIERNDGPPEGRPTYSPGPSAWQGAKSAWRMIWRRVAASGRSEVPPYAIYLVGMNVPADTDAAGLAAFNDFYTNVHVPEVVALRGFASGTRFELQREFVHPAPGCPRFCAIYEADEESTTRLVRRDAPPAGAPPLSSGPPTWEQHDTLWRLVYRRIDLA